MGQKLSSFYTQHNKIFYFSPELQINGTFLKEFLWKYLNN